MDILTIVFFILKVVAAYYLIVAAGVFIGILFMMYFVYRFLKKL